MDLLELFKRRLVGKNGDASKNTVKNYLSDTRHFISWFENTTKKSFDTGLITSDIVELYKKTFGGIIENGILNPATQLSVASLKRHLSSLRKFISVLKEEGVISENPFEAILPEATNEPTDYWHLKSFKDYLLFARASKITVKNYLSDIQGFARWYEEAVLPGLENPLSSNQGFYLLTQSVLEDYRKRLIEIQNAAPRTINRKLSSLRKYLEFATKKGFINASELTLNPVKLNDSKPLVDQPQFQLADIKQPTTNYRLPTSQSYSSFPPLRLVQKLIVFPYLYLEDKAANYIATLLIGEKVDGISRLPKKLRDELNNKNVLRTQNLSISSFLGINNIKKEFYAPDKVSLLGMPLYKKVIYHTRFTRPNWYKRYHNNTYVHYVHFALLVIFASGVGVALYQNLVAQKQPQSLAAATAPPRILSFQGRLTDNLDNPITTPQQVRFMIYNNVTSSSSAELWEEVRTIAPDQDGIFSVLLGSDITGANSAICGAIPYGTFPPGSPYNTSCMIPPTVFSDNSQIWLGVTIGSTTELSPRQKIATVGYATNSEFLQGQPPTTQGGLQSYKNVILALDSSGNLILNDSGTTDHTLQVVNGAMILQGQNLRLTTNTGSNGNVILSPDGLGKIDIQHPMINTTTMGNIVPGGVEVDDRFGVLATESAVAAFIVNNNTSGGDIMSASSSGTPKFTVQNDGTLVSGKYTTAGGLLYANGSGIVAQTSGTPGQCLTGGTIPSWGTCGSSYWNLANGTLAPFVSSLDLLIGGQSTASAKFGFINNATGSPTATISGNLALVVPTGNTPASLFNLYNNGSLNFQTSPGGDAGLVSRFFLSNKGTIGLGTSSPISELQVTRPLSYGATGKALVIFDQIENQDIFTASAGGITKFTITNGGGIGLGGNIGTSGQCITGGSTASWGICGGNSSPFQVLLGSIVPFNSTEDLLVGGQSTASAKFAVINMNTGTPVASISAGLNGGISISANGIIQTTNNQGLTIGGPASGDLVLKSYNNTVFQTPGTANTYVGQQAGGGAANTGTHNSFFGYNTGFSNTSGSYNFFFGDVAGYANTSGSYNTFIGEQSGSANTIGTNNTYLGTNTGLLNLSGSHNAFIGNNAGFSDTAGNNTFIGDSAGFLNDGGTGNVFIGLNAGYSLNPAYGNVSGNNNTYVGYNSGPGTTTQLTNASAFGYQAMVALSNSMVLGGTGTYAVNVGIGTATPAATLEVDGGNMGGNAALIVNQTGVNSNNIFTASSAALPKFTITNLGGIGLGGSVNVGTNAQCLIGGTAASWGSCSTGYWNQVLGTLTPYIDTLDLLVGGQTTASAKFRFVNVNSGTPVASISANNGNNATFLSGDGTLGTTNRQTLTIGNSSTYNTTGNVLINSNGIGKIGIGTSNPLVGFDLRGNSGTTAAASISATTSFATLIVDNAGLGDLFTASSSGVPSFIVKNNGDVVVGLGGAGKITAGVVDPYLIQNQKTTGTMSLTLQTMGATNADFIFKNQSTLLQTLTQAGQLQLPVTGTTGGLVIGGDTQIYRDGSVANQLDLASGDSFNLVSGSLLTAGTTRIDSSGNGTFANLTVTGSCSGCLSGSNSPFQVLSGSIVPLNSTLDFLIGGQATASAKFAVLNVNGTGPATATVSGNMIVMPTNGAGGRLGIGITNPVTTLDIEPMTGHGVAIGTNSYPSWMGTSGLYMQGQAYAIGGYISGNGTGMNWGTSSTYVRGSGSSDTTDYITYGTNSLERLRITGNGSIGFGIAAPISQLQVTRPLTFGTTGKALAIFDQIENQDIFTASSGGVTKFTITNTGGIGLGGSVGTSAQCLLGGATASWGACLGTGFASPFQATTLGTIVALNSTQDFLLGAQATASAKFAVLNMIGAGTPTASVSAQNALNQALVLGGDGSIQSVRNNTLTIGGNSTGNIVLDSNSNKVDFRDTSISFATNTTLNTNGTFHIATGSDTDISGVFKPNSDNSYSLGGSSLGWSALYANGVVSSSSNNLYLQSAGTKIDVFSPLDLNNNLISNIGNAGTDFTSGGGLTLASTLTLTGLTSCSLAVNGSSQVGCGVSGSSSPFQVLNGSIVPLNSTLDFMVGGQATTSAKFAVLNVVGSGTPTASVSAGLAGGSYLTANGILGTTANQALTLGSDTTGDLIFKSQGARIGFLDANSNVIFGYNTGVSTGGSGSTFVGAFAGQSNNGSINNVFIGNTAGNTTTTGGYNTYVGTAAGEYATGSDNTVVGYQSGQSITAWGNAIFGELAGQTITSGKYNTILGSVADVSTGSIGYSIALGSDATTTASNQMVVGGFNATSVINDVYIGNGVTRATALGFTLNATGGSGTDNAGANLTLAGGKGTGNAAGGSLIFSTSLAGGSGTTLQTLTERMRINASGQIGLGTTTPLGELHVTRSLTQGVTGKALAIFDQKENQDIFTASASGAPIFSITNGGGIKLGASVGTSGTCITGGTTAAWGTCGGSTSTNWWTQTPIAGAIAPINSTMDFLIGGQATASAKFGVLNIAGGTPTASISSGLNGAALYMTASGTLGTTAYQPLTLGSSTTGDIYFSSKGNSLGILDSNSNVALGAFTGTTREYAQNTYIGAYSGQNNTAGSNNVFVGNSAGQNNNDGYNTIVGVAAGQDSTGSENTIVGYQAGLNVTDCCNTIFGSYAGQGITTGFYNTIIGYGADVTTNSVRNSIALGENAYVSASNQLVIGGYSAAEAINDAYIGNGVTSTSPTSVTLNATGGSGTDRAGANLTLAGGKATGNAAGGALIFSTSLAGVSGTTLQSLSERMRINGSGLVGVGTSSPLGELHVTRALTQGVTGKALAIFDQIENQDIFSASASGATKFTITNTGGIGLIGSVGTGSQCITGGATAAWGTCGGSSSPFTLSGDGKAIVEGNTTMDFLLGATSTASAKFAVLNINNGTPTASVSSGLNGTGAYFDANGNFQTVKNQTLTLGGNTSGELILISRGSIILRDPGYDNIYLGASAGNNNYNSGGNAFVGSFAGNSNTGTDNAFFGANSGQANTSGEENTFIGAAAGRDNNIGWYNSFVGYQSGESNQGGYENAFFGVQSGIENLGGNSNAFFGNYSGNNNQSGNNNSFFGYAAGRTAIGANGNTTGTNNTFIGYNSGPGTTTQLTNATALGNKALVSASNALVLGGTGASAVQVGIGTQIPLGLLDLEGGNMGGNALAIFNQTGANTNDIFTASSSGVTKFTITNTGGIGLSGSVGTGSQCITGGATAGWGTCGGGGASPFTTNLGAIIEGNTTMDLLLGAQATASAKFAVLNMSGSGTPTASISAQNVAGQALVLGADGTIQSTRNQTLTLGGNTTGNVIIKSLNSIVFQNPGTANIFVGAGAGNVTSGSHNSFFGYQSGLVNSSGNFNAFFGDTSGLANTTGSDNAFLGMQAGSANTTGAHNLFVGNSSGISNVSGDANTFVGESAGFSNTVGYNTFVGNSAGFTNTTGTGNVFVGYYAGDTATPANANDTGSNSTFIGYESGPGTSTQLTNAAAIGYHALVSQDNSLVLGGTGANAVSVGIGTTTPDELLHIQKDGDVYAKIQATTGSGQSSGIKFQRGTTSDGYADYTVYNKSGGIFTIDESTSGSTTTDLTIDSGNVGIGTTTPIATLQTKGTDTVISNDYSNTVYTGGGAMYTGSSGYQYSVNMGSGGGYTGGYAVNGGRGAGVFTGGAGGSTYGGGGAGIVAIGGSVAAGGSGRGGAGIYAKAGLNGTLGQTIDISGPAGYFDGNNQIALIAMNGNVGIGTSTPGLPLDVVGAIRTTGNFYNDGGTSNLTASADVANLNKSMGANVTGSWSTGTAGGTGHDSHTSVLYNGKIYSWGGFNGSYFNTVDIYDIANNSWSTGTAGGTARSGHTSVLYNGKIYSWGGINGSYVVINTVDIYDIASNSWSTGTAGGTARYHHTSVLYNGKIYSWGGDINVGNLNTVDIYDIASNSWSTGTAGGTARDSHTSVLYNGKIYSWGGSGPLNTVDIYDIASNSWSTGTAGGTARRAHASVLYNGKIYSWGGTNNVSYFNTVDIYDIANNSWSTGTAGGTARYYPTSVLYNGKIYSWGGLNGGSYPTTVDIYDIGFKQSILALQENGQDTLSFQTGSQLFLSSGRLSIMGGNVGIGTATPSSTLFVTHPAGSSLTGKALAVFNQTENQDIFTASSSGITRFSLSNNGTVNIGTAQFANASLTQFGAKLNVWSNLLSQPAASISATTSVPTLLVTQDGTGDIINGSAAGILVFRVDKTGQVQAANGFTGIGGDFAEYYKKANPDELFSAGQLVCLSASGASKCTNSNPSQRIIGVISDNPLISGGGAHKDDPNYVLVGMVGQLGVWVTGDVKAGDPLSLSSTPGVATVAKIEGNIIGYAKESNDGTSQRVEAIIQPNYYNPNTALQNENIFGQLSLSINNGVYSVVDALGNSISHIDAFSKIIVGNIEAGFAHIKTLAVDTISAGSSSLGNATANTFAVAANTITIGGQDLRDIITQTVTTILSTTYNLQPTNLISPLAQIDTVKTNMISPLADTSAPSIGFRNDKAVILSHGQGSQTVAWFDNQGNASFSGQLTADSLTANNATIAGTLAANNIQTTDASVSGTLRAGNIIAANIEGLDNKISSIASQLIASNQQSAANQQSVVSNQSSASSSSQFSTLNSQLAIDTVHANFGIFEQGITSMGPITSNIITATDQLAVGNSFTISNNAINTVGADLELQSLKQGNIAFEGGLIRMDTDGNMTVNGNMDVLGYIHATSAVFSNDLTAKTLTAGLISPIPASDLVIQLNDSNSNPTGKLKVQDNTGHEVLSVNSRGDIISSGSAQFAKLNLNFVGQAQATSLSEAIATGSAGFATLRAGQPELTIKNPNITSKSLIYITPFGDTNGQVLYLLRQIPQTDVEDGTFTVGLSGTLPSKDMQFNWLIVN